MEYEVKWYKFHRKTLTWTMAEHSKLHGKENRLLKRNIYLLDEWRKKSAQHTQGIIGSWHGTHERKLIYDFTSRRLCSSYINIPSATKRYFFLLLRVSLLFCVRAFIFLLFVCMRVSECLFVLLFFFFFYYSFTLIVVFLCYRCLWKIFTGIYFSSSLTRCLCPYTNICSFRHSFTVYA